MIDSRQQDIWEAAHQRCHLVPSSTGLATGMPFASHLVDGPGVVVAVLPSEPRSTAVDVSRLLDWLPNRFTGRTANGVSALPHLWVADGGGGRVSDHQSPWRGYVAVRRHGGVEVGIGAQSARFEQDGATIFRLHVLVHAVRVAVDAQRAVLDRVSEQVDGPYEVVIAIPGTGNAGLGARADGWSNDPWNVLDHRCAQDDIAIREQVEEWPVGAASEQLVVRIAGRICNAFGFVEDLFAPQRGGAIDPGYA